MRTPTFVAATALVALATACAGEPPRADGPDSAGDAPARYVALGDSYTAAPGAGAAVGSPSGCGRTEGNYPRLVATELEATEFTDVSCGAATTAHLSERQETSDGTNPPQLSALNADTTLVTVGIGGNDIGLVELAGQCGEAAAEGTSCDEALPQDVGGGLDGLLEQKLGRTIDRVSGVLRAITERAPDARVVVVGYPTILPEDVAECAGRLPHSAADLAALRDAVATLNQVLEQEANAAGADFADTADATGGHHVCAPEDARWVEGLDSVTGAAPLHPTARGERAMADAVLTVLREH